MMKWIWCVVATCWIVSFPMECLSQEKSVQPGINDNFRDPNIEEWVGKFEIESRETFDKRMAILEAIGLKEGMVVADVGAGTGLFTRLFASAVGTRGKVIAQDISQKFLDHIMKTAVDQKLNNIRIVLGKDTSAELPSNSIDVVFLCDVYHHFEFPEKMMQSIRSALRPEGRVVIVDFAREEGKSSDWVLKHVRAGQSVVESEVESAGFRKVDEKKNLLSENYFIVFQPALKQ
jgi:predicted methyltransferase